LNKPQDTPQTKPGIECQTAPEIAVNQPPNPKTANPTEAPLADFLQRQTQHRTESAEAFEQDATSEPSMRELLQEQVKLQRQVHGIKNHVMRVQQGLMICQLLNVLIAGTMIAVAAFLYLRPGKANLITEMREPSAELLQENEKLNSAWATEAGQIEDPEITPDHIFIISEFMQRARELKLTPTDTPITRQQKKALYVNLLVDLSEKGEEFAAQREPQKVCEMLVKVAKYAKGNLSFNNDTQEQQELVREIHKFCWSR
jgi:hypothetical protein